MTRPVPFRTRAAWRRCGALMSAAGVVLAGAALASPAAAVAQVKHPVPPAAQVAGAPGLGPDVYVFTPDMPQSQIQATVDAIAAQQVSNQFGTQRYALLFEPGTYGSAADPLIFQVGYYTQVAGLGAAPGDVVINGSVDVYNQCLGAGGTNCIALDNFWRSLSNLTINVTGQSGCRANTEFWAVSQAAPMRRVQVNGGTTLMDYCTAGPQYASGGFIADSAFSASIVNGSQQQFFVRNSNLNGWSNGVWNQVFSGDNGAPAQSFGVPGSNPYTTVAASPVTQEEPFLYTDSSGRYQGVRARAAPRFRRAGLDRRHRGRHVRSGQPVLHRQPRHPGDGGQPRPRDGQEPDPDPWRLLAQPADPGAAARHDRARPRLRHPDPGERDRPP